MILGSYQALEEFLSPILRGILEFEAKMFEDLNQLYNVKGPKVFFYLDRGNGTITLTPMCLNDANLAPRIQSKTRKSKNFYSLEWRTARSECESKQLDCIYNLIWYEPVAMFICMLGDRRRVFVCFSPLLDIKGINEQKKILREQKLAEKERLQKEKQRVNEEKQRQNEEKQRANEEKQRENQRKNDASEAKKTR